MRAFLCYVSESLDRFSASVWAHLVWWAFCIWWIVIEKFNIGYDGFASMLAVELFFAGRREAARRDPRDRAVEE